MSDSIKDELGRIMFGVHYDADEMREHPELHRARIQGVTAANHRWHAWLRKQGYSAAEAACIIGTDMDADQAAK